jgi:hypothetical protein
VIDPERLENLISRTFPTGGAARTYPGPADFKSALVDYFRATREHVADMEPMARQWRRDGMNIQQVRDVSGLSSADFGNVMEASTSDLLRQRYQDRSADTLAVCGDYPVDNFREVNFAALGLIVPGVIGEEHDIPRLPTTITESGEVGALKTYSGNLAFSYPVWTSHGDTILAQLNEYGDLFSLLEQSLLVSVLENSALPTSTSTGFDLAGLNKASNALRSQVNGAGQKCNLSIAAIVAPPELEWSVNTVLQSAGKLNDIRVVILNDLSVATTWFAVASPQLSAPLLRLRLRNSKGPSLYLNRRKGQQEGIEFSVSHDCAFAYMSSVPGVVKCTA